MTPGARVAAAIEILDSLSDGLAPEQALTRWARQHRFAGSKDRAAIRDHVFDVLRLRNTAAHYGQGTGGRALMIGVLHHLGADLGALFNGAGHAPAPLSDAETAFPPQPSDPETSWNLPSWLVPLFEQSLGAQAGANAIALQGRAPICLRVNLARTDLPGAQKMLENQGVLTEPNPLAKAALTVTEGARRIRNAPAFLEGHVELQDAASQAVAEALPAGGKALDYCAGGGGKALALAMDPERDVFAHDITPARMSDLPARAARAGAQITQLQTDALGNTAPFDIVLCDAPCSGSGAWRRAPAGKWALTPERVQELNEIQDSILTAAAPLVAPGGVLAYATCSVLRSENEDRIARFLDQNPAWEQGFTRRFDVTEQGDGFFTAHLTRK